MLKTYEKKKSPDGKKCIIFAPKCRTDAIVIEIIIKTKYIDL